MHDSHRTRVLVISPFQSDGWIWLSPYFAREPYEWTFRNTHLFGKRPHAWLYRAICAAKDAAAYDLVISHTPYMTLYVALAMRLLGIVKTHWAFTFNNGAKRFFAGPLLAAARAVLPSVEYFQTCSQRERHLFHRLYGIPLERIGFQHWAVSAPQPSVLPQQVSRLSPYICCLGRNNRDFGTFLNAIDGLPVNAVIVCPRGALEHFAVPNNVAILSDIPLAESEAILANCLFSVVPILDPGTGSGHMTIVAAMHLGKAQVVTRIDAVNDYFFGGLHGLWAPLRSPQSMRAAIVRLLQNPRFRADCGSRARCFADRWLSEAAAVRHLRCLLECWRERAAYPCEPEHWSRAKAELLEAASTLQP